MPGTFYGYREQEVITVRPPPLRPQGTISPMKLSPFILETLSIPAYDYFARSGDAPENFPTEWITLPWTCRLATWTLRGGPIEVQVSFDGTVVGDQRTLRASNMTLGSFAAYRVRQLVPGFKAWYQLFAII